jgi:hypothetical protein
MQCHKSLYLNKHHRELRDPIDQSLQAIFRAGREVGMLARELFPGGIEARAASPFHGARVAQRTRELIQGGAEVIYEGAFIHDGVLAYIDILVRQQDGWHAFEVKSTGSVKEVHVPDVAIQAHLIQNSGIDLADFSLVHLNTQYVRQGDLDVQALFVQQSILDQVSALAPSIPDLIAEFKAVLTLSDIPEVPIGLHCTDPYDCDFCGYCWREVPEQSLLHFKGLKKAERFELFYGGAAAVEDIPPDYALSDTAAMLVESHRQGTPRVDTQAIAELMRSLRFPQYFLDFETINPAIPLFDHSRPYQQIPYQYSLYRVDSPEAEPAHSGFLAEAGGDPRPELLESLLRETEGEGDIITYNLSFEKGRLNDLADVFPQHREAIEERVSRMKDLMTPFRKRQYYAPRMLGSYSIKAVLPALVPELSYDGMAIADGTAAMIAFLGLQEETNPEKAEATRNALWEYCKLDTLAMVRILEKLQAMHAG